MRPKILYHFIAVRSAGLHRFVRSSQDIEGRRLGARGIADEINGHRELVHLQQSIGYFAKYASAIQASSTSARNFRSYVNYSLWPSQYS